jgi:4-hydroxy-3-polyprenylbenzoate decarboxylase
MNSLQFIKVLKEKGLLRVIEEEVDVNLEIGHIAYVEAKKGDTQKALLFTSPVDREKGIKYQTPLLMNIFNKATLKLIFNNRELEEIANEIEELLKPKKPKTFMDKIDSFKKLWKIKNVFPKEVNKGECQEVVIKENIDLEMMPILKTWEKDGGKFITMGQVYTKSLDGEKVNLGMYRLQIYDKKRLGLHWQIHKDSSHFFHEYKKAKKRMPVSIAIGGDPLYTWCATAPLPIGMNELFLYGFIKDKPVEVVKSITNDIFIPKDVDFVIEGYCNPEEMEIEGMFGDHTGYYTLKEPYPVLNVTAITHKKEPVFYATVVGKPPIEDKYMGYATERIFLPLLKTQAPDLIDYRMPENGVFHNLILCKIDPQYKGHSLQIAHALWGVGQMSFVKHAIFVGKDAPHLEDYHNLTKYILDRFSIDKLLISKGIVDALDHSSSEELVGGKLGIDCTGGIVEKRVVSIDDLELFKKVKNLDDSVIALKQYFTDSSNPICVIQYRKRESAKNIFKKLKFLENYLSIVVFVDEKQNDVNNPYMLIWRVTNNIDANRDIFIDENFIAIDGTNKSELDGFEREWPEDVNCSKNVIEKLLKEGLIDITEREIEYFQIY